MICRLRLRGVSKWTILNLEKVMKLVDFIFIPGRIELIDLLYDAKICFVIRVAVTTFCFYLVDLNLLQNLHRCFSAMIYNS